MAQIYFTGFYAPAKTCRHMPIRIALIFLMFIFNSSLAASAHDTWTQPQLNMPYMRALTKDQCVQKTIHTLKSICVDDQCLKTMAGVMGDCVEWAKGNMTSFCKIYTSRYEPAFCAVDTYDKKRCLFMRIGKEVLCHRQ